jgi:hypothetical protein
MKKIIVTTTINAPTQALELYAALPDWDLIVVGDLKTPHSLYKDRDDLIYLSPDEQTKLYPELSEVIGWNCIQRRNIGFVHAFNLGADIMATVDDDNIPYENWGQDLLIGKTIMVDSYTSNGLFFDPISTAIGLSNTDYDHNIWHRGYPVQLLYSKDSKHYDNRTVDVKVQAAFWDGDPDVDAICRIANSPIVKFENFEPFTTKDLTPFNSQNTFIAREVIPKYMMIPHVGRMDDIWGAYIYQQMTDDSGIVFTNATVRQDRNEHNLVKDLENEVIGYRDTIRFSNESYEDILPTKSLEAFRVYQNEFKNKY